MSIDQRYARQRLANMATLVFANGGALRKQEMTTDSAAKLHTWEPWRVVLLRVA